MTRTILFYVFGRREAHLAELLIQDWRTKGYDVQGAAYCYREAAAARLRSRAGGLWAHVISDTEVLERPDRTLDEAQLSDLEHKFGAPNLWRHAIWDRHLSTVSRGGNLYRYGSKHTRSEILHTIAARLNAVSELVDSARPSATVFVSIDVGSGSALATHQVSQHHNLSVTVPVPNRLGSGTLFFSDLRRPPRTLTDNYRTRRANGNEGVSQQAVRFVEQFQSGSAGMRVKRNVESPTQDWPGLRRFTERPTRVALSLRDRTTRHVRRRYGSSQFRQRQLPDHQRYVLMPLHLEPELALLAYAPEHYDQVAAIRQVAQSLPGQLALAVREHPVVRGQRPLLHYREISKIPNTFWGDPSQSSLAAIQGSEAVVSVTGSSVFEAAILGRPNLLLGRVWFDVCASVGQELEPGRLPDRLTDLEGIRPDPLDVLAFISAVIEESSTTAVSSISKSVFDKPLQAAQADDRFVEYAAIICRRALDEN